MTQQDQRKKAFEDGVVDAFNRFKPDQEPPPKKEHKQAPPAPEYSADDSSLPDWEDVGDLVRDFANEKIPLPRVLVEGTLHAGTKMVLGGGSKSCKTWALIELGMALATGSQWLGKNCVECRVLFINFEVQREFFAHRAAMVMEKNLPLQRALKNGNMKAWNLRGHSYNLADIRPVLENRIKKFSPDVIILDPLYKCLGDLDENSAGDMSKLMHLIEKMCEKNGASAVFGAHFSKGNQSGKDAIDRISGSGVFGRDPDSIFTLTRHEEDNCFTVSSVLRNFKPTDDFTVRWVFPSFKLAPELDPERLKGMAGRKPKDASKVLTILSEAPGGLRKAEWVKACIEGTKYSKASIYRAIDDLVSEGTVIENNGVFRPSK